MPPKRRNAKFTPVKPIVSTMPISRSTELSSPPPTIQVPASSEIHPQATLPDSSTDFILPTRRDLALPSTFVSQSHGSPTTPLDEAPISTTVIDPSTSAIACTPENPMARESSLIDSNRTLPPHSQYSQHESDIATIVDPTFSSDHIQTQRTAIDPAAAQESSASTAGMPFFVIYC